MNEKNMQQKPYNDLKSYLIRVFGGRVYKITIDAGLSCPNRIHGAGCIYCNERGSGTGLWEKGYNIETQIRIGMEGLRRKYRGIDGFIAYFQSYTNTYAPLQELKANWDTIRKFSEIKALSVGTRPDCIDPDRLNLLNDFSADYKIFLELGLQSINEETLLWIGRGHDVRDFTNAVTLAAKYPFHIVAHVIFGFPEQDIKEIIKTAQYLSDIAVHGVKIHLLYVAKGSRLADIYQKGAFIPVAREKYVEMVCTFLEHLSPAIVIHRLTGDAHRGELVAPLWSTDKAAVIREIENMLLKDRGFQGKYYGQIESVVEAV